MPRYIDVDNALKVIYDYKEKHSENRSKYPINYGTLLDFINQISNIHSENVRLVVRGKWVGVSPMVDTLVCSNCGENIISEEFKSNFCPNCGADMREVEE